jgi:hypothetical protein
MRNLKEKTSVDVDVVEGGVLQQQLRNPADKFTVYKTAVVPTDAKGRKTRHGYLHENPWLCQG